MLEICSNRKCLVTMKSFDIRLTSFLTFGLPVGDAAVDRRVGVL